MPESAAAKRVRARAITARLEQAYPDANIALRFETPLQLLVATILAAQCTDERVNQVTPGLFGTYHTATDFAGASPATLEGEVRSTGFFRAKTRAIIGMARALVERHGGEVPRTMEDLTALPGVGRKTANVLLGNAFGVPGIAVDTHVFRVSQRLGLAKADDPDRVEAQLAEVIPRPRWTLSRPTDSSWLTASRTTVRLTPSCSLSSASVGRRSPGRRWPCSMTSRIRPTTVSTKDSRPTGLIFSMNALHICCTTTSQGDRCQKHAPANSGIW